MLKTLLLRPALVAACCIVVCCCLACSENPFSSEADKISGGTREVRGEVQLNDRADPGGAFVWLENFNLATRTDASGHFKLRLPPPGAQSGRNGATGIFNLYFYVANYNLATVQVATHNGDFVYAQQDIGPDGSLDPPPFLRKVLRIQTRVTPATVSANRTQPLEVELTLQALADTVTVVFPHTLRGSDWIGALIIRRVDTPGVYVYRTVPASTYNETVFLNTSLNVRRCTISLLTQPLPPGEYEIIPYFLIRHHSLPIEMHAAFGPNFEALGPNYLQIPMRREGGRLLITP